MDLCLLTCSRFPRADDEFHGGDLRNRPSLGQCINIFACSLFVAGNGNQNVAVDQVRHAMARAFQPRISRQRSLIHLTLSPMSGAH